jgi:hypothetical protein
MRERTHAVRQAGQPAGHGTAGDVSPEGQARARPWRIRDHQSRMSTAVCPGFCCQTRGPRTAGHNQLPARATGIHIVITVGTTSPRFSSSPLASTAMRVSWGTVSHATTVFSPVSCPQSIIETCMSSRSAAPRPFSEHKDPSEQLTALTSNASITHTTQQAETRHPPAGMK